MNTEYALNRINTMITNNLNTMLATIDSEVSASRSTPTFEEIKIGLLSADILTTFPCLLIYADTTNIKQDEYQWQDRRLYYEIIAWVVENDPSDLHRFVLRYGDAIVRILRKESNWIPNLHSPIIREVKYSDLYQSDHGLAQGCMVQGEINYIISNT
jgi:hypothetical protein